MTNMLVAHIELKTEESADIKPYTHERIVDKIVVPLGQELTAVREQYLRVNKYIVCRDSSNNKTPVVLLGNINSYKII